LQQSQNHRAADSGFAKQGQKSRFAAMGKNFRLRPAGAIEKKFLGLLKTKRL